MAVIATIGSAGVGATWGWLLGIPDGNMRRPLKTILAFTLATAAIAGEILALASRRELAAFGFAAFLTLLLHIGWRRDLRLRIHQD